MSWAAAVPLVGKVIDKLFPDANKASEAKAQLAEMMLNGELEELEH